MATRRPLALVAGDLRELPAGDDIPLAALPEIARRNDLLAATILADARALPVTLIDRWADGFGDSSGVVAGSSSNHSVDTVNRRTTPTHTAGSDQTGSPGSAISSQDASGTHAKANAFDNSNATHWRDGRYDGAQSGRDWIGWDFGSGVTRTIASATVKQDADGVNTLGCTSVKVEYSADGSTSWTEVSGSPFAITANSSVQTLTFGAAVTARAFRIRSNANVTSGFGWGIQEVEFVSQGSANNMTLVVGDGLSAQAAFTRMRALVDLEPVDSIALATDFTVEVSRDGGTTWAAAGTYTNVRDIGVRDIVETDDIDVSGQPAGTSPRARLKSFNNKSLRVHGVALMWG